MSRSPQQPTCGESIPIKADAVLKSSSGPPELNVLNVRLCLSPQECGGYSLHAGDGRVSLCW